MTSYELSATLRAARLAAGLTLRQVAARVGLSLSYISNIEHNRASPTLANLDQLAAVYGLECRVTIGPQSMRLGDVALSAGELAALRRLLIADEFREAKDDDLELGV